MKKEKPKVCSVCEGCSLGPATVELIRLRNIGILYLCSGCAIRAQNRDLIY